MDEDGLGYTDIGEEVDWGTAEQDENEDEDVKGKKKMQGKRKAVIAPEPGARQRMQKMFQSAALKKTRPSKPVDNKATEALLDDILENLDSGMLSVAAPPSQAICPAPQRPSHHAAQFQPIQPSLILRPSTQRLASSSALQVGHNFTLAPEKPQSPAEEEVELQDDYGCCDDPMSDSGDGEAAAVPAVSEGPKGAASMGPMHVDVGTTPGNTLKSIGVTAPTPPTCEPVIAWEELYSAAQTSPVGLHEHVDASPLWVDDGTLPLDSESQLPFYMLDAHEENSHPGTVYLFGKVATGNNHYASCCAVVRGLNRNVFFVPREDMGTDPEIARLADLASTDTSAKKELIPRLHQALSDVKAEVRTLLAQHGITQMTMKPVQRNYAFENPAVRHGVQWVLKVRYPATQPALPLGLSGDFFSAAFGTNQSCLESLILKRKVMGPGWLKLARPKRIPSESGQSWCTLEVEVDSHKAVTPSSGELANKEAPPLTVAALSLKTMLNSQTATNEVVGVSVVYLGRVKSDAPMEPEEWNTPRHLKCFSAVRKMDGAPFPVGFDLEVKKENDSPLGRSNGGAMVSMQSNEKGLLTMLIARLRQLDTDVFVGHNIAAFDLDVLLHRMQHHKVPHWSSLGRLRRTKWPRLGGGGHSYGGGASPGAQEVLAGRLVCDTYLQARDLVKEVDYTLTTLSKNLLGQTRSDLSPADICGRYETAQKLLGLVRHTSSDAYLGLRLAFYLSILPLTRQLASLSGSSWGKALAGQRAQRIEMLLLHEFYSRKFMLPDKLTGKERDRLLAAAEEGHPDEDGVATKKKRSRKSKGPQYAGGLVLEPKKGLYDRCILLLDFNSLYPSIIQEYNICFTTVSRPEDGTIPPLPEPCRDAAPLPRLLKTLVQRRRSVKDMLRTERDPTRRSQLEIRQQALKLTANSMYGCLGFSHSRFYARPLAELITSQGREILQSTVDLVQNTMGKDVVYGDTDSIMVDTGSPDVSGCVKLGAAIKAQVNKRYRLLEIEMDGVYKCMLLLKKKKYAAIKLERTLDGRTVEVIETKGLDIVRRDWCPLCKDVGNFALRQILSGSPAEDVVIAIHEHLNDVKDQVRSGNVPLNKFVITKQLTKSPEEYPDAKNQPHVQVALRRRAAGKRDGVAPGETVPYIIAVEINPETHLPSGTGDKGALAERARHPEEITSSQGKLLPDADYYLAQQVFPVISRLCAPIDGTDPGRLAESLGLDSSRYRTVGGEVGAREDALLAHASSLEDDDRYKHCEPLMLTATADKSATWQFAGIRELVKAQNGVAIESALLPPSEPQGEGTAVAKVPLTPAQVANQVTLAARKAVAAYYQGRLKSDDDVLPCDTRNICLREVENGKPGTAPPDPRCAGAMKEEISEAALYTQLSYLERLFDTESFLQGLESKEAQLLVAKKLAPLREALDAGAEAANTLRNASKYRWVDLGTMFGSLAKITA